MTYKKFITLVLVAHFTVLFCISSFKFLSLQSRACFITTRLKAWTWGWFTYSCTSIHLHSFTSLWDKCISSVRAFIMSRMYMSELPYIMLCVCLNVINDRKLDSTPVSSLTSLFAASTMSSPEEVINKSYVLYWQHTRYKDKMTWRVL